MTAPRYQEFEPDQVPVADLPGGVKVHVIAGKVGNVLGPVNGIATAPTYLDVELPARASASFDLPPGQSAFAYPFEGDAAIGDRVVSRGTLAVLGDGNRVVLSAKAAPSRVLLVAGQPLNESVVRYGPFVMNTQEQIRQAIADYQAGGF
jgi:redox-sensitive bicupin YhaK (pirin superfamily)